VDAVFKTVVKAERCHKEREMMSEARRALRDFPQEQLTAALLAHYRQLLTRQGL
jgi:hypothetical protein